MNYQEKIIITYYKYGATLSAPIGCDEITTISKMLKRTHKYDIICTQCGSYLGGVFPFTTRKLQSKFWEEIGYKENQT